jgi:hypothetical protein
MPSLDLVLGVLALTPHHLILRAEPALKVKEILYEVDMPVYNMLHMLPEILKRDIRGDLALCLCENPLKLRSNELGCFQNSQDPGGPPAQFQVLVMK